MIQYGVKDKGVVTDITPQESVELCPPRREGGYDLITCFSS